MQPDKICRVCGRRFAWRRKWADSWDLVKTCSAGCRRAGIRPLDRQLERTIVSLLEGRAAGKTICPSEAARSVADDWRPLMERTRRAARRLVARGVIEITQRGRVIDATEARGPIRLRLRS